MFDEVFAPIDEVSEETNYWLFRTESGNYYDYFYEKDFIAIGWNYITLQDLTELSRLQIKDKVAQNEGLNLGDPNELRKATLIVNKLFEFKELKKGDVIIIPSKQSSRLAFGLIEDNGIYTETEDIHHVEFYKRRNVEWFVEYPTSKLDPVFFKMTHTHHVMSSLGEYDKFIDRVMHSVYKKNGFAHVSLEVGTDKDVDVETLIGFVRALQDLTIAVNESFDFGENVRENSIRLNIQSPGIMEMKLLRGQSLMMLAVVLNIMACGDMNNIEGSEEQKEQIQEFVDSNDVLLDTIRHGVQEMRIDIDRFNNIY